MPLLFCLGQHEALQGAHRGLRAANPERVGPVCAMVQGALRQEAGISIHVGKTKIWNQAGVQPGACDILERAAHDRDPDARVWRGAGVPPEEQGIKILGTPIGHPEYVRRFLIRLTDEHQTLLDRIPLVGDVRAAWLLLVHCAAVRATCSLRCVDPEAVEGFARRHDQGMMECLSSILHTNLAEWMSLGGLGVRSAVRTSGPAQWASWADCLTMVQECHPDVASLFVDQLAHPTTPGGVPAAIVEGVGDGSTTRAP